MPGTHHVEARVFKDVFPRYRTMKGYHVPRKAGWDCHGLPVEIAVEKELGFSGKPDIEAYGVAEFNAKCRESVERHVDAFEEMTERMGYWVDTDQAYRTMDPSYVQSVWWSLKQVFDRGLLVRGPPGRAVLPPMRHRAVRSRAGPGLRDRRRPVGLRPAPADLRAVGRRGVSAGLDDDAVDAGLEHRDCGPPGRHLRGRHRRHRDARGRRAAAGDRRWATAGPSSSRFTGAEMDGGTTGGRSIWWTSPTPTIVVLDEYVTTEDGTGLVHQAPAFGADDLRVCRRYGLPVVNPVRPDGTFAEDVPLVGGQFFKHADAALVKDLDARGLLFRHDRYEHAYPHCWRCHTPLLYYAQPSWYIRTTAIKDALLRENERTTWYPETIKWGRYGEWLRNNVDWALSRSRYWGTPLPVWRCDAEARHIWSASARWPSCPNIAGEDLSALDPHRPYVDDVTFDCAARRRDDAPRAATSSTPGTTPGAMPFAQWGYPYAPGSAEDVQASPTRRSTSARHSTRPVAGSTR